MTIQCRLMRDAELQPRYRMPNSSAWIRKIMCPWRRNPPGIHLSARLSPFCWRADAPCLLGVIFDVVDRGCRAVGVRCTTKSNRKVNAGTPVEKGPKAAVHKLRYSLH